MKEFKNECNGGLNNKIVFTFSPTCFDNLGINSQIEQAEKKLKKAVKKEKYLKAAKYRDLLIELKAKRDEV